MKPISIYVHIPFCVVKCGYCDFNAYAGMDALKLRYRDALLAEVEMSAPLLADRSIVSIAFGGGTPGEVPARDIGDVIGRIRSLASVASDTEISLEANPGTSTGSLFAALRSAGVTRLSLGAQSFDADNLRFLDRVHSVEAIGASVRSARAAGFESLNIDLIYGLPGQNVSAWHSDLETALELGTDHLSLYCLTVEEGTPLHRRVEAGDVEMPSADEAADLYDAATDLLESAGFEQYEISNWARPGHRSVHNLGYWSGRDYLGVGAGAHGFVDGERYENIAHPRTYIETASAGHSPRSERYRPEGVTAISDWLTTRLRVLDGFAATEFQAAFGMTLTDTLGPVLESVVRAGVIDISDAGVVRLTQSGRLLHGEACAVFLRYLEDQAVR